jgi:hypothetical protein
MSLSGQDRYGTLISAPSAAGPARSRLSLMATKALLLLGAGASLAWMSGLAYLAGRLVMRGMTLL